MLISMHGCCPKPNTCSLHAAPSKHLKSLTKHTPLPCALAHCSTAMLPLCGFLPGPPMVSQLSGGLHPPGSMPGFRFRPVHPLQASMGAPPPFSGCQGAGPERQTQSNAPVPDGQVCTLFNSLFWQSLSYLKRGSACCKASELCKTAESM